MGQTEKIEDTLYYNLVKYIYLIDSSNSPSHCLRKGSIVVFEVHFFYISMHLHYVYI